VTPVVVSPSEVAAQVGKLVTVRGRVDGQKTSKSGHTYLNFGGRYPNHVFSCFFNVKSFSEPIPMFEGKEVEVTGTVTMYQDKPQIEVSSLSQIRVLEEEGSGSQKSPDEKPTEPAS
jgi:exonuclease VII large subunit